MPIAPACPLAATAGTRRHHCSSAHDRCAAKLLADALATEPDYSITRSGRERRNNRVAPWPSSRVMACQHGQRLRSTSCAAQLSTPMMRSPVASSRSPPSCSATYSRAQAVTRSRKSRGPVGRTWSTTSMVNWRTPARVRNSASAISASCRQLGTVARASNSFHRRSPTSCRALRRVSLRQSSSAMESPLGPGADETLTRPIGPRRSSSLRASQPRSPQNRWT